MSGDSTGSLITGFATGVVSILLEFLFLRENGAAGNTENSAKCASALDGWRDFGAKYPPLSEAKDAAGH